MKQKNHPKKQVLSPSSNLEWNGFRAWTELPEDVIVVSAQLTDWHETSARQAIVKRLIP